SSVPMDKNCHHALSSFEQAPSDGLGLVERGDGRGPVLCAQGGQHLSGGVVGPQRQHGCQQLREFCYEAVAKRGVHRQELVVESCFAPLLAWVLKSWERTQVALALDATHLGPRFIVLALSVLYRGCAIPVAWTVVPAGEKHAWRREWLRMLRQ